MVKLTFVLCVLAIFAFAGVKSASHPNAPTPAKDCSTVIFSMADCLSFVTNGSKITKPEGGCCSGLKTVLKTDAECLCEAFKSSGQLGVVLNVTKALSLPTACGVHAPSITKCGLSPAGAAPAHSPKSSSPSPTSQTPVSPAPAPAPALAPESGEVTSAPAPAPSHASSASSISFITLFVSLVAAAWCSYY